MRVINSVNCWKLLKLQVLLSSDNPEDDPSLSDGEMDNQHPMYYIGSETIESISSEESTTE